MVSSQGFWSYVHVDDQAERERISILARDVAEQFKMLTGESLTLFLDKDAIKWGEGWRDKIDASLAVVAFFIPVMTPRYFMSAECRRELQFFARRATDLGIKELVLPLLYVDVPALHDKAATDDLITLIGTFQWEDWRELRFADVSSEGYRRGVARLATRLVDANRQVEKSGDAIIALDTSKHVEEVEEPPGFLDRVAASEEAMPRLTDTIQAIGHNIEEIGRIATDGTAEIKRGDNQGKGYAARLLAARKIASLWFEPVEHIVSLANDFTSQLHDVDEGFRAIIEVAGPEVQSDQKAKLAVCKFFDTIRSLSASSHKSLNSIQAMIDSSAPLESLSRDLRPVLRRLKQGLTKVVEGREVTDEWVQLIDSSGVACDDASSEAS